MVRRTDERRAGSGETHERVRRAGSQSSHVPPPADVAAEQPPGNPDEVARIVCSCACSITGHAAVASWRQHWRRRGVPDEAADRVLNRFAEVGLIDDEALAHTLAGAQHRERGLARRAVAMKLRQRGFDNEVVADALTEINDTDERRRAIELVARKHRSIAGLPLEVRTRRLVGLLGRKGYPAGLAWDVVRAEIGSAEAEIDA